MYYTNKKTIYSININNSLRNSQKGFLEFALVS